MTGMVTTNFRVTAPLRVSLSSLGSLAQDENNGTKLAHSGADAVETGRCCQNRVCWQVASSPEYLPHACQAWHTAGQIRHHCCPSHSPSFRSFLAQTTKVHSVSGPGCHHISVIVKRRREGAWAQRLLGRCAGMRLS